MPLALLRTRQLRLRPSLLLTRSRFVISLRHLFITHCFISFHFTDTNDHNCNARSCKTSICWCSASLFFAFTPEFCVHVTGLLRFPTFPTSLSGGPGSRSLCLGGHSSRKNTSFTAKGY